MSASTTRRPVPALRFPALLAVAAVALATSSCGLLGGEDAGSAAPDGGAGTGPAAVGDAAAVDAGAGTVTVQEPWFTTTAGDLAAGYATVWNQTGEDVTIVSATSATAGEVQLRDPSQAQVAGLLVPAGGYLSMSPGSASMALLAVADPIEAGEQVSVTLTLDTGTELEVTGQAIEVPGEATAVIGAS